MTPVHLGYPGARTMLLPFAQRLWYTIRMYFVHKVVPDPNAKSARLVGLESTFHNISLLTVLTKTDPYPQTLRVKGS